ncbi:Dual oxidase 1, partial [Orchesella cincta]
MELCQLWIVSLLAIFFGCIVEGQWGESRATNNWANNYQPVANNQHPWPQTPAITTKRPTQHSTSNNGYGALIFPTEYPKEIVSPAALSDRRKPKAQALQGTDSTRKPETQGLHGGNLVRKPQPSGNSGWIKGRKPVEKLNLISWLIDGCLDHKICTPTHDSLPEYQTFDGFFNNIFQVELGAVDTPLLRRVPPVYEDGVYQPVKGKRINPFVASDELMTRTPVCGKNKSEACGSKTGKTAFLVFFGQQVVEEVLDAQRPGCPPEYFNIEIPKDNQFNVTGKKTLPLLRSRWSQTTGQSPGNPRQQLNEITPWIDGGLIYGTAKGWADVLRTRPNGELVQDGLLASVDDDGLFPAYNKIRLPLANPPPPANHSDWVKQHATAKVDRFFVLGNPRGNENAFLLSFGVVLFRWHNHIATYLRQTRVNPDGTSKWSGERIFQEARKWVIATYQHLVIYKWIPEWLGEELDEYRGYDPSVDPQIEQFFQTAAMRFGHTLVTPGAYMRDFACGACRPVPFYGIGRNRRPNSTSEGAIRTCNIFWRPQGMASQRAEREDNMIVEDLRGQVFGPLEFSRRDLMAINIQRGRDHGTPDYNTARESFGLKRITSVKEYMKETNTDVDEEIITRMEEIHQKEGINAWDNIDVWTGGILETSYRPGPLFRAIIKDQFTRIRNADRFWFENRKWKKPRFTEEQIERIKLLEVFDLIVSTTRMKEEDLQPNPFRLPLDDFKAKSPTCRLEDPLLWVPDRCTNYDSSGNNRTNIRCYHFPQLDSNRNPVEQCTPVQNYDYFDGSEISYIVTYSSILLAILGIASLVPLTASYRQKEKQKALMQLQKQVRTSFKMGVGANKSTPSLAREWMGHNKPTRAVALLINEEKKTLELRSLSGNLLRVIDLSKSMEIVLVNDGKHIILKNSNEYDCVLEFESSFLRDSFYTSFRQKFGDNISIDEQTMGLRQSLSAVTTKETRIARLETFFKVVFAHAFAIEQPKGNEKSLDAKVIKEVFRTELTQAEFAEALGMQSSSTFVERMFNLVDRDNNGFISFREFLDMLIIFSKGTAEDKMKLMFDMYDISRTGYLSTDEFKAMIRSLVEASKYEVSSDDVELAVRSMLEQCGLKRDSKVSFQNFQELLSHPDHKKTLGYADLNFSGVNVPQTKGSRKSHIDSARSAVLSIYGDLDESKTSPDPDELEGVTLTAVTQQSPFSKWVEVYRLQIFWGILYTLVFLAIFFERAYVYSVESEHGGLRQIAGYGVSVTRGAASAMMFAYATLLLTMCRNSITILRETFLHRFIPFDSFLDMHKYIAILGLVSSFIHIVGHSMNFYHISTQTSSDLSCLFTDYFRPTHVLPKFHYWAFQTITGITGIILVLHAALIYIFATAYARANAFRMFWATHATYPLWYVLMLLHGSGRLVQDPLFGLFLVGPLVIFILDKLITIGRKKVEIPVLDAKILPSNVTKLVFARPIGFEYKSGQWVRIASLDLNPSEFHPFTISSAPHEPHLTLHIRAVGPFTANIRQLYDRSQKPLPKLYLDGPYGEGHQDWWRYEVSVLVGGGIGVTPFASILKDVAANQNPRSCKKIYFIWVTRTQKQFEWMVDIIRLGEYLRSLKKFMEIENCQIISVHLFITQTYQKFDMRTVLLYICERHFQRINNKSLFTGLRSITHFGRPNFVSFFRSLTKVHPNVKKFGVFSCGPFGMTKNVDEACAVVSTLDDVNSCLFQHHYENF